MGYGEDVVKNEADREKHRTEEHTKPRRDLDELYIAEIVSRPDVPEKAACGEYPPWVTEESLVRSSVRKEVRPVPKV